MNEKAFKTMTCTGAGSIAIGILMILAGAALGVVTVINGARLLKDKRGLTF